MGGLQGQGYMRWSDTTQLIASDMARFHAEHDGKKSCGHILAANPGLWVLIIYRLRRYACFDCNLPLIKPLLKGVTSLLSTVLKLLTTIEIPVTTEIGSGAFIPHVGNIVVHYQCRIGRNCTLTQGVTIGQAGRGNRYGVPVIGDNVYMAPGAKILGNITVGDHAVVGANAVVTRSVPDYGVVGGIPAHILNMKGSADFIRLAEST